MIVLAVLSQPDQERYGYSLLKRLSDQGLEIDQGTLYPLLRRLESQGLPRKNRLDIETELRSTLEDMLEDRSQGTGRPADEALAAELLQEYGAPRKVAATYQAHPYLIGPRMFPTYTLVLKITLFAVALGLTIATVVSVVGSNMTSPELLQELVDFVATLVSALVAAFAALIIFNFYPRIVGIVIAAVPLILAIVVLASTFEIVKDVMRMLRPGKIDIPFEKGT